MQAGSPAIYRNDSPGYPAAALRLQQQTRQRGKIIRGLELVAASSPSYKNGAMPDVAEIGLACVLDYLDFRKQVNWRDHAPNLAGWLTDFAAAVPGYDESLPPKE